MSFQPPSAFELEIARRYDQEHARVCLQPHTPGLVERLRYWREERLVRNALKVAGEPGLILDVACGVGRYWPVLAGHANRVILATDPSQDILDHARTHHPQSLFKRVKTFQSSAFAIGLSENAVDCIFCMQVFQHLTTRELRLAMLGEFHRVSRDTVIVAVHLDGRFQGQHCDGEGVATRSLPGKAEVENEIRQAGFSLLNQQDFLPGCARMRVYVLGKAS
ncbi:SAM-dependent methyltransferase [Pseudomonas sp. Leaf48]|jgi:SAM-dependent methyltransferase|uniref:class I SAM-dependent methyltransferase n=1 Tax=Pseudomonas sp. Leaf48 TaxID=1736221 RepID=UPI00072AE620|nr:class I SAM-dependent methyltransferase [Pseudomonas sp. Leaf48]KQN50674.1 SAM-dependent methyltransferase [Pseudomonas sp. Leaf48]